MHRTYIWWLAITLVGSLLSSGCCRGVVCDARDLWEDGNIQGAVQMLEQALEHDPKNKEARLLLGEIQLECVDPAAYTTLYYAGRGRPDISKKVERLAIAHVRRRMPELVASYPGKDEVSATWGMTALVSQERRDKLDSWLLDMLIEAELPGPDAYWHVMRMVYDMSVKDPERWDVLVEKAFRSVINGTEEEQRRYQYGLKFSRKIRNGRRSDQLASEAIALQRAAERRGGGS